MLTIWKQNHILDVCFQNESIFGIVRTEQVVYHRFLGNQICPANGVVLYSVFTHQFPCGSITYAAEHLSELNQINEIGVFRKFHTVFFASCHGAISLSCLLSMTGVAEIE